MYFPIYIYIYTKWGAKEPKKSSKSQGSWSNFVKLMALWLRPPSFGGDSIAFNALLLGHSKGWEVLEGVEMEDCRRFFGVIESYHLKNLHDDPTLTSVVLVVRKMILPYMNKRFGCVSKWFDRQNRLNNTKYDQFCSVWKAPQAWVIGNFWDSWWLVWVKIGLLIIKNIGCLWANITQETCDVRVRC